MENKRTITEVLEIVNVNYYETNIATYREYFRDIIFPVLLKTKEFENVKGSRVIDLPVYINTVEDILGLGGTIDDVLRGDYINKPHHVVDFRFNPNEEDIEFNDYVQIYDISIVGLSYKTDNLPNGMWLHPTIYDPNTFAPKCKFEFIFDIETLMDMTTFGLRDELINQMFSLIDSRKPNVPYDTIIVIRCSPESIKQITKKQK